MQDQHERNKHHYRLVLGSVDQLFEEKESGGKANRPALQDMVKYIRSGDDVVVWSIDRLARNLRDLQDLIGKITDKGARITFLSEQLTFGPESDDPFAKLQLQMMGAFAEFERAIIRKRQAEGIAKAKQRGVYKCGKPRIDRDKVFALRDAGKGPSAIGKEMGVSRMSVYRILKSEDRTVDRLPA